MRKLFCDICTNEIKTSWASDKCEHQLKIIDHDIEHMWDFETCGKCLSDIKKTIFDLQRKYLKEGGKAIDCSSRTWEENKKEK